MNTLLKHMLVIGCVFCPLNVWAEPVVDSAMTMEQAMYRLDPACPTDIRDRQYLLDVDYYGFDGELHQGQLVLDERLVKDVQEIFDLAKDLRFPFASVIPVAHEDFYDGQRWSDDLSMAANNTSAFNYRPVTGGGSLSKHAYGYAIDINPALNPYIKNETVLPPGAVYNSSQPGVLSADHPIVKAFKKRGWTWGGNWTSLKDYQHFEKVPQQ